MDINLKPLEKQTYNILVIREKKNPERDEYVKEVHERFKQFCNIKSMNNFTMGLAVLMDAYERPLEFDMLQDMILANQLEIQQLKEKKEEPEEKVQSTF